VLDEDWLVLSTMHSAKGLEFDVVYIIHAADGNVPSDMSTGSPEQVEEERRLFYVACTRARHHLYVSHPLRYYKAGNPMTDVHGYALRTRFLPDQVMEHFLNAEADPNRVDDADEPLERTTTAHIRDTVRRLW
jgi:DNA helicase-2/ATP-dependent DNA helicase PcrA